MFSSIKCTVYHILVKKNTRKINCTGILFVPVFRLCTRTPTYIYLKTYVHKEG